MGICFAITGNMSVHRKDFYTKSSKIEEHVDFPMKLW